MRRAPALVLLVAVLLTALAVSGWIAGGAVAQDATPAAEEFAPEGVTFEPLGFGTAEEVPAAPADLVLARATIDPGASVPLDADDPSVALIWIESGTLTVQADAPIRITRAAMIAVFATPGAVEEGAVPELEEIAAGTEFTLEVGDSAIFPPHVVGEIRNDGQERVVALVAIVAPPADMMVEATPAP